jgi:hypothetical protein
MMKVEDKANTADKTGNSAYRLAFCTILHSTEATLILVGAGKTFYEIKILELFKN